MSAGFQEKIDPALRALPEASDVPVDVIVSIAGSDTPAPPAADRAAHVAQAQARFEAAAAPVLARLAALAAEQIRPLWLAHAVAARLPRTALAALAAEDTVTRITPDTARKMI